jgi:hypothetical protein
MPRSTASILWSSLIAGGLSLVGLLAYLYGRSSPVEKADPLVQRIANLESQLRALGSEERDAQRTLLAALAQAASVERAERASQGETGAIATGAVPADVDVNPMSRLDGERARENANAIAQSFENHFSVESADEPWASATASAARATIEDVPDTRLIRAECATRLCRIVVEHDTEDGQRGLAHSIRRREPFDEDVFYGYERDSRPRRTTLYVAREGVELAALADSGS